MALIIARALLLVGLALVWVALKPPVLRADNSKTRKVAGRPDERVNLFQLGKSYPSFTSFTVPQLDLDQQHHGTLVFDVTYPGAVTLPAPVLITTSGAAEVSSTPVGVASALEGAATSSSSALEGAATSSSSASNLPGAALRNDPPREKVREHVEFRTLWPTNLKGNAWDSLLVYMYSGVDAYLAAREDFRHRLHDSSDSFADVTELVELDRGAEVEIVPDIPGFIVNPERIRLRWLEPFHCAEFRVSPTNESSTITEGRVMFFVGPLLIAETLMSAAEGERSWKEIAESCAFPYHSIFVSYSHTDETLVEELERAYTALGISYLRDVNIRSGDKWREALRAFIDESDLFQLCWSTAAKESSHVAEEWRYAFSLGRPNFIRPVYWERPMPDCPTELKGLQFARLRLLESPISAA
jgi:hypothetical protein